MLTCSQGCGRPAMVRLAGDVLCLGCAQSFRQILDGYNNTIAVQYNHLLDMADASVDIPRGMPRMPVTRPAAATVAADDVSYKHVDPAGADVAVINREGQIDRIDLTVESFAQRGGELGELSELVEGFVNAVLTADALRSEDKSAVTHVVSTLLTQLETPAPKRMPKSLLMSVHETVSPLLRDTADLVERWEKLGPKVAERLGIDSD